MGMIGNIGFEEPEYHLENVVVMNQMYPDTFLIPSQNDIKSLQVGAIVLLIFVMEDSVAKKNGTRGERMWVKITNIQNNNFIGVLYNEPFCLKSIQHGDTIIFKSYHIAQIKNSQPLNENLFAMTTKRALESKRINEVYWDEPISENDSGWQLFYGDEDEAYIDNLDNAATICIKHAIEIEPSLEDVFRNGQHKKYTYSRELRKFI